MKKPLVEDIVAKALDCLEDCRDSRTANRLEACVNRAYYAVYHSIQALLTSKGIKTKTHDGAHNAFHKEFMLSSQLPLSMGMALKRSFEKRHFGDYDYDDVSEEDASESVLDAEQFVNATIEYLKANNHLQ